jgi:hypothetical protein
MTWLTLRQLRVPAAVVHLALAAVGLLLVVTTRAVTETGVYALASASVVALPAVLGVFWAAPLIARELETATSRSSTDRSSASRCPSATRGPRNWTSWLSSPA